MRGYFRINKPRPHYEAGLANNPFELYFVIGCLFNNQNHREMKFFSKDTLNRIGSFIVAMGALAGFLSLWLQYNGAKFHQPVDQQDAILKNYNESIALAEKQHDEKKADGLRREMDKYLSDWRDKQQLTELVPHIIDLPLAEIPAKEKERVKAMLSRLESAGLTAFIPKGTLGDAQLISGDAGKAAIEYTSAIAANPDSPQYYSSRARAYAVLTNETTSVPEKEELARRVEEDMDTFSRLQKATRKSIVFPIDPIVFQVVSEAK